MGVERGGADSERRWSVWRQDEHGNRFEVARDLARDEAHRAAAAFEARGHKQRYWVEPTRGTVDASGAEAPQSPSGWASPRHAS